MNNPSRAIGSVYRELVTLSGPIAAGDSLRAAFGASGGTKIDFRSDDNAIHLHIAQREPNGPVLIARNDQGEWETLKRFPCPGEAINLEILFGDDITSIDISGRGGASARWSGKLSLSKITKVTGTGNFDAVELKRCNAGNLDSRLIVRDIAALPTQAVAAKQNLIFDIGLYNGDDTDFYLWRGFDVVAVEANPSLAEAGAVRFLSSVNAGRLRVVNCAIADTKGTIPFFVNRVHPEWSSTDYGTASRGFPTQKMDVNCVNPAQLFAAYGVPHYLKVDIEGSDSLVLLALRDLPVKPQFVSFEVGPKGGLECLDALKSAGYRRFAISDQSRVHLTKCPRQSSEQGQPEYFEFKRGSSGAFGDDLSAAWLDYDSTRRWAVTFLEQLVSRKEKYGRWYDIHAALD